MHHIFICSSSLDSFVPKSFHARFPVSSFQSDPCLWPPRCTREKTSGIQGNSRRAQRNISLVSSVPMYHMRKSAF